MKIKIFFLSLVIFISQNGFGAAKPVGHDANSGTTLIVYRDYVDFFEKNRSIYEELKKIRDPKSFEEALINLRANGIRFDDKNLSNYIARLVLASMAYNLRSNFEEFKTIYMDLINIFLNLGGSIRLLLEDLKQGIEDNKRMKGLMGFSTDVSKEELKKIDALIMFLDKLISIFTTEEPYISYLCMEEYPQTDVRFGLDSEYTTFAADNKSFMDSFSDKLLKSASAENISGTLLGFEWDLRLFVQATKATKRYADGMTEMLISRFITHEIVFWLSMGHWKNYEAVFINLVSITLDVVGRIDFEVFQRLTKSWVNVMSTGGSPERGAQLRNDMIKRLGFLHYILALINEYSFYKGKYEKRMIENLPAGYNVGSIPNYLRFTFMDFVGLTKSMGPKNLRILFAENERPEFSIKYFVPLNIALENYKSIHGTRQSLF